MVLDQIRPERCAARGVASLPRRLVRAFQLILGRFGRPSFTAAPSLAAAAALVRLLRPDRLTARRGGSREGSHQAER